MPIGGEFQNREDDTRVEEPSRNRIIDTVRAAGKFVVNFLPQGKALKVAAIVLVFLLLMVVVGALGLILGIPGGDNPRQGTSASQPLSEVDKIKRVLALTGDNEAFRLNIIENAPQIQQNLEKLANKVDKLPDATKNHPQTKKFKAAIETARSTLNSLPNDINPATIEKLKQSLSTVTKLAAVTLSSTQADLLNIAQAPIAKMVAYKSVRDAKKRRMYFFDKDGNQLGSVRIEIGSNHKKTAGFRQGDKATPTGNFTIYEAGYKKEQFHSSYPPHPSMGFWRIAFQGPYNVKGRGVVIHGTSPQFAERQVKAGRLPLAKTAGCIAMTNADLEIVGPLIYKIVMVEGKKIPLEIKA